MQRSLLFVALVLGIIAAVATNSSNLEDFSVSPLNRLSWQTIPAQSDELTHIPSFEDSQLDLVSTVTREDGFFQFSDLNEASHQVWIDLASLPSHLKPNNNSLSPRLLLNPGQSQTSDIIGDNIRFSATYDDLTRTLSGWVFQDLNLNGIFDETEGAIANVTVIDPGVFVYFIPAPNEQMLAGYEIIDECTSNPNDPLDNDEALGIDSVTSITASNNDTTWFYDFAEDGYDADVTTPGPTTLTGNLNAGESEIFQTFNDLRTDGGAITHDPPLPPSAIPLSYGGSDRITVIGEPVNITRNAWPGDVSTVLAGSWEAYAVNRWGVQFVIPVGEELDNPGVDEDFESTQLFIMAQGPNTVVIYDPDGPGPIPADAPVTLDAGESLHVFNDDPHLDAERVFSGATIQASDQVQVHMLAGDCGEPAPPNLGPAPYVARGFHILNNARLHHDYYVTTPLFDDAGCGILRGGDRITRAYIHNIGITDLNINWETRNAAGVIPVPAGQTVSFENPEANSGLHLFTANSADRFSVVVTVDASSQDYDWGYTPVSEVELTSQVVLGWSPGTITPGVVEPPGEENGNLAFVVPVRDTTIFVDLDNDNTPDNFDMDGDGEANTTAAFGNPLWDETNSANGVFVERLEVLRVADPTDFDMNGASIYAETYEEIIAVAWGEDPCTAHWRAPHFDGGFTVPPLPVLTLSKDDLLERDPPTCTSNPGSLVSYTVVANNIGRSVLNDVRVRDVLPSIESDFIIGSLVTTPPADGVIYNDGTYVPTGASGSPDPAITSWQAQWNTIGPRQAVTMTFEVQVDPVLATGAISMSNSATVRAGNLPEVITSSDPEFPGGAETQTCINTPTPPSAPTITNTPTPTPTPTNTPEPSPTDTPQPNNTPTRIPDTATPPPPPQVPAATPTPPLSPTVTPEFPSILPNTGSQQTQLNQDSFLRSLPGALVFGGLVILALQAFVWWKKKSRLKTGR